MVINIFGRGKYMAIVAVGIDLAKNARQGYVEQRTALINRIRGMLSDLGTVLPLKATTEVGVAGGFGTRDFAAECFKIYSFLRIYHLG
jgi:glucose uptake protein GlcU